MTLDQIEEILGRLGLPISYRGQDYIATSSEWRGGDNMLGVRCYSENIWDSVALKSYKWVNFIQECKKVSKSDAEKFLSGFQIDDGNEGGREERIKIQETLREEDAAGWIKSYDFFLREPRKISKEVLDIYQAGLCQSGRFYGRVSFPIRSNGATGKLIGITGRDVLKRDTAAKWKIVGKKSEFIYPLFYPNIFRETKQIVLIESVGDSLSLSNAGILQNLVTFGLHISPKIISFILQQNPDQIFIALNNDVKSEMNRGQIAAEKMLAKLKPFFDIRKIIIAPPIRGDFGEMNKEENLDWAKKYEIKVI